MPHRWHADEMASAQERLHLFASYLSLVYHEAGNVRHLIKEGFIARRPYEQVLSLPKNRENAWAVMQDLRTRASRSGSAEAASKVFANQFRLDLEELVDLYEDRLWRHSAYGGNRWSGITQSVIEPRDALDQGGAEAADLLDRIPAMRHNTGQVEEKLHRFDAALQEHPRPHDPLLPDS
jgi:hypothetical protein